MGGGLIRRPTGRPNDEYHSLVLEEGSRLRDFNSFARNQVLFRRAMWTTTFPPKFVHRARQFVLIEGVDAISVRGRLSVTYESGRNAPAPAADAHARSDDPVSVLFRNPGHARRRRVVPQLVDGSRSLIRCYNGWAC